MQALVGLVVGAVALWVGWRRLKFVGAYWKRHQHVKKFEQALRDARASAEGPSPYRIATDADAKHVERLGLLVSQQAALVEAGYRVLGDLIAERDGDPFLIVRVLVSRDGHIVANLSVSMKTPVTYVNLSSYDDERLVTTMRGAWPSLARPPFVLVTNLPEDTSIANLVAVHQAPAGARTVSSLQDVVAGSEHIRERTQAWRASQPPDELLDADLRMLLGKAYTHGGKRWAARLRSKLPQATARRV